ncbi:single-stranded DNA-binding protein [Candidatus Poribacteria bacterium]|nr:single-stranded DNA-binding protein [Candidatus Poribacteria bacterium]
MKTKDYPLLNKEQVNEYHITAVTNAAKQLRDASSELIPTLLKECKNIDWIYNPLEYAWAPHAEWIRQFSGNGATTLLVGMNPGHGMGNTGVPFGCPEQVRNLLKITGFEVHQPDRLHPKRPVLGLECPKPEISGQRIWSFLAQRYGSVHLISQKIYIVNHCPLWMFNHAGKNITPDKLTGSAAKSLKLICSDHLLEVVKAMEIKRVIGIGRYAQRQVNALFNNLEVGWLPHPSPASPFANRNGGEDWRQAFELVLKD